MSAGGLPTIWSHRPFQRRALSTGMASIIGLARRMAVRPALFEVALELLPTLDVEPAAVGALKDRQRPAQ
jgi:hypothetical protein